MILDRISIKKCDLIMFPLSDGHPTAIASTLAANPQQHRPVNHPAARSPTPVLMMISDDWTTTFTVS
jgi:hypothetical protein